MKYSELLKTWEESREEWRNYEWNAAIVAAKVYKILKERFELEDEKLFKLIDPDEKSTEKIQKTMYSHVGATKLSDHGWAKFGIYLLIETNENTWPKNPYKFVSYVKITRDNVLLKVTEDSEPIELNLEFTVDDENLIEKTYDGLLNHLIKNSFKNWLNS